MAETTDISWADATFNPWIGCTRVSPGCDHCYAATLMDDRYGRVKWGAREARSRTSPENWKQPLRWNREAERTGKPCRVFCASLADVFDNEVDPRWRADLFRLIHETPALTWMLLTKRIGNATGMIDEALIDAHLLTSGTTPWPWPNVWLGATVVNQEEADRDIPKLLAAPARVRWLSCEPLLGPITLPGFNAHTSWCPVCNAVVPDSLARPHENVHGISAFEEFNPARHCIDVPALLGWVIVGGESGKDARPMNPQWARDIRDQCAAADVPFHFKQWGEWVSVSEVAGSGPHFTFQDGRTVRRLGKTRAGHLLDGVEHRAFPMT